MKHKAIFLDRDGVINVESEGDYVYSIDTFIMLPDVIETVKHFHDHGFLIIIISNQGGIAKKIYSIEDVEILHEHLKKKFLENGILITEIYYCPHYPGTDSGNCLCRKPGSLMIEKAIARFNIDLRESYFIGDKQTDMEAAQNAGVKSILVKKNGSINFLKELIHPFA